jgi:Zn-dependent peptidase ImmA (M78 family)
MLVPDKEVLRLLRKKKIVSVARRLANELRNRRDKSQPIEEQVASLGITIQYQSLAANGYLTTQNGRFVIAVNKDLAVQIRRFTVAHELAHWLLQERFGISTDSSLACPEISEAVERACDHFGCLVLPSETNISTLGNHRRIDFGVLEKIVQDNCVPMRAIVIQIQDSGLLNATEQAIVTFRPMVNPWQKNDWDLRIWHSASPAWGFIPDSIRASKLGFAKLREYWPEIPVKAEIVLTDCFSVLVKRIEDLDIRQTASTKRGPVRSWFRMDMTKDLHCKVYSSDGEGLFIVSIFSWERPKA